MKPATWENLPLCLLRRLLEECELEYDPYEGSKAERIEEIENGSISAENHRIVSTGWKMLWEETFAEWCRQEKASMIRQIQKIDELLLDDQK